MRKSGWAAAAGLGSLVLLLTACGGSSGSSSTSTPNATTTANPAGQASSGAIPAKGSTVLIVQKSALGYVLAVANGGQVVYTYAKDTKGGTPTCTGSCASIWPPVTGIPVASPGFHRPGHVRHGHGRERRQADHLRRHAAVHVQGREGAGHQGRGRRRHVARDQAVQEQRHRRLIIARRKPQRSRAGRPDGPGAFLVSGSSRRPSTGLSQGRAIIANWRYVMRKSGWAAATGLGSLVLLLAACGGSGSTSAAGSASSTAVAKQRVVRSGRAGVIGVGRGDGHQERREIDRVREAPPVGRAPAEQRRSVDPGDRHDRHDRAEIHERLRARRGQPPGGLHVLEGQEGRRADLHGFLRRDLAAGHWNAPGRTRRPFPWHVHRDQGEQIAYDGYPLYTLKGAKPLSTSGNGMGGLWHVVKLSASDISV